MIVSTGSRRTGRRGEVQRVAKYEPPNCVANQCLVKQYHTSDLSLRSSCAPRCVRCRSGWGAVKGRCVVLIVRNFWDAVDSYFNMCLTNTHDQTLADEVRMQFWPKWERMVRHECEIWQKFNEWWLKCCERSNVPIMVVRFEDLVSQRRDSVMGTVLNFIGCPQQPKPVEGARKASGYKPRSGGVGGSLRKGRFSAKIREEVVRKIGPTLKKLGFERITEIASDPNLSSDDVLSPIDSAILKPASQSSNGTIVINRGSKIREDNDEFGRMMTLWRREHTANDTTPFPTIPKTKR